MAATSEKVRILLIRPWTERLAPFRSALRDARIDARITRVDIEPALNAALGRSEFDIVLFDPKTPNVTRELVELRIRDHRRAVPIVTWTTVEGVVDDIKHALAERLN